MSKRFHAGGVALAALLMATGASAQERLISPDGRVAVEVALDGGGVPQVSVSYAGRPVVASSQLGLDFDSGFLGRGLSVAAVGRAEGFETYDLMGKFSRVEKPWREMTIDYTATVNGAERRLSMVFRAYDDGAAFRYIVPDQPGFGGSALRVEQTVLGFPVDYQCWGVNLGRVTTSHEGEFDAVRASVMREHNWFDAPLVCQGEGAAFALAESDVDHYPAVYFTGRGDGGLGVQTRHAPRPTEPGVLTRSYAGSEFVTPWRVVMLGETPGDLTESTLVTDLATAPQGDFSWVRPGRSAWDWWNGPVLEGVPGGAGMNTATFERFIDFAHQNGLEYILIDEGWYAGAGGGGTVRPGADITRMNPAIDIPHLVRYGRERGVGVWLWMNWIAFDAQMDQALDLYQSWGVAGLKIDFMDRDDQPMVDWYHRVLREAASHRLMVNFHGAYHPTGLNRTFPNYVTQEGILGAEYNKWSGRITARHNVTLPYTRFLVGPGDYTPAGFRNVSPQAFEARNTLPMVQTTRAHQLAMAVVFDSPMMVYADTPDAYRAAPEDFAFLAAAPAVWDETRFISGDVGESVVMARRSGRDWFIGAMTNEDGRSVTIPLDFLGAGRFEAQIWADGDAPDQTVRSTQAVAATDALTLDLKPTGGAAVRIRRR